MRRKDVHLEKHAAGRLLEGAGDRIRREMTVRSLHAADRTRLTDWLLASVLHRGLRKISEGRFAFSAAAALLAACARTVPPAPVPGPVLPAPTPQVTLHKWTVPAWQGEARYQVSRSVRVEGTAPTGSARSYAEHAAERFRQMLDRSAISVSLGFDSSGAFPAVSAKV